MTAGGSWTSTCKHGVKQFKHGVKLTARCVTNSGAVSHVGVMEGMMTASSRH